MNICFSATNQALYRALQISLNVKLIRQLFTWTKRSKRRSSSIMIWHLRGLRASVILKFDHGVFSTRNYGYQDPLNDNALLFNYAFTHGHYFILRQTAELTFTCPKIKAFFLEIRTHACISCGNSIYALHCWRNEWNLLRMTFTTRLPIILRWSFWSGRVEPSPGKQQRNIDRKTLVWL